MVRGGGAERGGGERERSAEVGGGLVESDRA